MAGNIKLGLVIGGAVSSSVGAAFSSVEGRIKALESKAGKSRVLQSMIGDTIKLREEWRKAHATGAAGASTLLNKLNGNLDALKAQGIEVAKLGKAYEKMGHQARSAEFKAKGHQQINQGKESLKSTAGQAVMAAGAVAIPTKISAEYNAIIRDIAIKAGVAGKPQEAQMSQTIIQTSRDSGMARNDVADLVNQLVGAGMEVSKALEYAPVAAKFAIGQGSAGTDTAKMINALGQNAKITDPKVMQQALEAIAYQGQAGSFEAADMAKWFPELLANMAGMGITGMDAVTQLGAILQVQMKSAGSSDEAANNLKNWVGKIGASETVDAYSKAGIDYEKSMQTGLQGGKSTLESSFELAQKYIEKTDPKKAAAMAEATAKISKEADPSKAKAMLNSLNESLKTGDIFADMQVKAALQAYLQNKALYNDLKSQSRNAGGILDKNLAERRDTSAQKWTELAQAADDALRSVGDALRPVTDAAATGLTSVAQGIGSVTERFPDWVAGLTLVGGALLTAKTAFGAFTVGKGLLNLARGGLAGRGVGKADKVQEVFVTNANAVGTAAGKVGGTARKEKEKSGSLMDVGLAVAKKALGGSEVDKDDDSPEEGSEGAGSGIDEKDKEKPKGMAGLALRALESYQEARENSGDEDGKGEGDDGSARDALQRVFVVNASEVGATTSAGNGSPQPGRTRRSRRTRGRQGQSSTRPIPDGSARVRPPASRPDDRSNVRPPVSRPPIPRPDDELRHRRPGPLADGDSRHRPLAPPSPQVPDASDVTAKGLKPLLGRLAGAIPGEALINTGMQAYEIYQSEGPLEEKLEAAMGTSGGALGAWGGAAAGAAIGTLILPGVGTAVGAAIGGAVGEWGGGELGDVLGKFLFGQSEAGDEKPEVTAPVSLLAPTAPPAAGESVLGSMAKTFNSQLGSVATAGQTVSERPAPIPAPIGPLVVRVLESAPPPATPTLGAVAQSFDGQREAGSTAGQVLTHRPAPVPAAAESSAGRVSDSTLSGQQVSDLTRTLAANVPIPPTPAPVIPVRNSAAVADSSELIGSAAGQAVAERPTSVPAVPLVTRTERPTSVPAVPLETRTERPIPAPAVPVVIRTERPVPTPIEPLVTRIERPVPTPSGPALGDVARALAMPVPTAQAPAVPVVVPRPEPTKVLAPRYEQKVDISAPITLTVQGDVKDPQQFMREVEPMIQRAMRDAAQQAQRASLFDAPHVEQ
ncbi:phage tail tape measure protein [Pseudomonas syringae]|nr:phage tail tape measure protein [Pseudomonas syringae]MBD8802308.1 phage tail tape measure protein [Pseudomonas syringae]MBD8812867.1 phage tail tape measure protein [Pseudomonas syringae]